MAGKVKREIEISGPTCLLGFSGRDWVGSMVFDPTGLAPGGVNEVQTLTVDATGGTFKLSFRDQQTGAIAEAATAATVQAALQALSHIGVNGVTVTGSAGGPYTITFGGKLAAVDVPLITTDATALTGGASTAVVVETTKGSSLESGRYVIKSGLVLTRTADGKRVKPYTGATNISEVQTVTISGTPTGGTFTLEYDGEQTAAIAYNATAAAVQSALEALPNLDAGDVVAGGGPGPGTPYTVTFAGDQAGTEQPLMRAVGAFTGGTNPAVNVAQTVQGSEVEQIVGIFDGRREFFGPNDTEKEIPVYNHNCVFDKAKVQGFAAHEGALRRWAAENDCVFRSQGQA